MSSDHRYRLCFLGAMIGRHPGHNTTQGLILADLFAAAGYDVRLASASLNRYVRLADVNLTLLRGRRDIDVVIVDVYGELSFVVEDSLSFTARRLGLPLIYVLRGGAMPEFVARHPAWTRRVLSRADLLVAPSPFLIEALSDYGYRIRHLPNVVNLAAYEYRLREQVEPRLFWMRSFHDIYNPEMAVRVLARLRERYPAARLIMAGGDKGSRTATEALAVGLGVGEAVEFPGFLTNEQKVSCARRADIFINTPRVDNMPVALVEAGALGMPIVSTNVGGIPYMIRDGLDGLLVNDGDDEAMAAAIGRLVETPALAAELSRNGRALAERSSWNTVRSQWEALFAEAVGKRRARSVEMSAQPGMESR